MVEIYKVLSEHDKINTPLFEYDSNLMKLRCHNRKYRGNLLRQSLGGIRFLNE